MTLTGIYQRNLDEKGRLALPKRFRLALSLERTSIVYLTPGTNQSLQLHSAESLEAVAGQLQRSAPGSEPVHVFARLFYAQTENCELDAQGRIRVPNRLALWADLSKEVVLLGVGTHIEIWNSGRWDDYFQGRQAQFDSIVYRAFDGGSRSSSEATREEQQVADSLSVKPK